MGILERVHRIVSANVNQLLDRAEDPQKSLLLHLEEMRGSVQEARVELVRLGAAEKLARRKHEACLDEARRWEARAVQALRAGDEELARQALGYKHEIDLRAEQLLRQAELSGEYVAQLQAQLEMLERKAELANLRSQEIAGQRTRQAAERAQGRRRQPVPPLPVPPRPEPLDAPPPAFDEYERIDERISDLDAEMDAVAALNDELFDPSARTDLDRQFLQLERERDTTEGLVDLRRKLDGES